MLECWPAPGARCPGNALTPWYSHVASRCTHLELYEPYFHVQYSSKNLCLLFWALEWSCWGAFYICYIHHAWYITRCLIFCCFSRASLDGDVLCSGWLHFKQVLLWSSIIFKCALLIISFSIHHQTQISIQPLFLHNVGQLSHCPS